MSEIFVPSNEGCPFLVLEAHAQAAIWTWVEAIEVLDRGDNGIGGIMGVDVNSHG